MRPTAAALTLLACLPATASARVFDLDAEADAAFRGTSRAGYGTDVASAGDFNGDGIDDFVIPVPGDFGAAGGVHLYLGTDDYQPGVSFTEPDVIFVGVRGSGVSESGTSVALAGDVNGDGLDDLLIGARTDSSSTVAGAYLVYGRRDTESLSGGLSLANADVRFRFGPHGCGRCSFNVASAGDVNGDGLSDLLVGNPEAGSNRGVHSLVYGQPASDPLFGEIDLGALGDTVVGDFIGADLELGVRFGDSVAGVGDMNGDGFDDFMAGASNAGRRDGRATGEAYLFDGGPGQTALEGVVFASDADAIFVGQDNDQAGRSIAPIGDLNGDGLSDVIIGAAGVATEGDAAAYIVYGRSGPTQFEGSTPLAEADIAVVGPSDTDWLGWEVSGAGDVDRDGIPDVLFGAPRAGIDFPTRVAGTGEAYLIYGKQLTGLVEPTFDIRDAAVTFSSAEQGGRVGMALAPAGDVDNDGFDDLLVGAPADDLFRQSPDSAAFLLLGRTLIPEPTSVVLVLIGLAALPPLRR